MNIKLALVLAMLMPATLLADSYKCKLQSGATEIRDSPCPTGGKVVTTMIANENDASARARAAAAERENERQLRWANGQSNARYREEQAIAAEQNRHAQYEAAQQAANQAAADRRAEAMRQQQISDELSKIRAEQEKQAANAARAANEARNSKRGPMNCYQHGKYIHCD